MSTSNNSNLVIVVFLQLEGARIESSASIPEQTAASHAGDHTAIHAEPSEEPLQYQINSMTQGATCTTRQPNDSPPAQPTEAQEIAGIDRHSHPLHAPARLSNGRGDHIFAVGRRRCRHDPHNTRLRSVREQIG